jgi:hypothetical protein
VGRAAGTPAAAAAAGSRGTCLAPPPAAAGLTLRRHHVELPRGLAVPEGLQQAALLGEGPRGAHGCGGGGRVARGLVGCWRPRRGRGGRGGRHARRGRAWAGGRRPCIALPHHALARWPATGGASGGLRPPRRARGRPRPAPGRWEGQRWRRPSQHPAQRGPRGDPCGLILTSKDVGRGDQHQERQSAGEARHRLVARVPEGGLGAPGAVGWVVDGPKRVIRAARGRAGGGKRAATAEGGGPCGRAWRRGQRRGPHLTRAPHMPAPRWCGGAPGARVRRRPSRRRAPPGEHPVVDPAAAAAVNGLAAAARAGRCLCTAMGSQPVRGGCRRERGRPPHLSTSGGGTRLGGQGRRAAERAHGGAGQTAGQRTAAAAPSPLLPSCPARRTPAIATPPHHPHQPLKTKGAQQDRGERRDHLHPPRTKARPCCSADRR